MLKPIFSVLGLAALAFAGQAQVVALFAVNQPPQFQVDAGSDLDYTPGLTLQVSATGGTSSYSYLWAPAQYLDDPTSPTPEVLGLPGATLFSVQVTDLGLGCTLTDEVQVDFTLGARPIEGGSLAVFPNPSNGLVRIQAPIAVQVVQLRSSNGMLAMEEGGRATRDLVMDVFKLPAGVYFMTIRLIDGRSYMQKLCTTYAH